MVFSYRVKDRYVLKDIQVPFERGKLTVLTGVENIPFSLIGGILSGLFPVEDSEPLPQIEELIKDFTGELEVSQGEVPPSAFYLGPDPEKHLLFSRVDEEIYAQTGRRTSQIEILATFGLGDQLHKRKISSLSGGEKMKLALCIAFSKPVECIVLHGVLPWLDKKGKICLLEQIQKTLSRKACVIILEQEIEDLLESADYVFYFDGREVISYGRDRTHSVIERIKNLSGQICDALGTKGNTHEIVRFDAVGFHYEQDGAKGFGLENISFTLSGAQVYGMIGDNGTGKSTIAKLVLRTLKPNSGSIFLLGRGSSAFGRDELVRMICFMGQFPEQHITLSTVQQYKKRALIYGNSLSARLLDAYFPGEKEYPISSLTPLELKVLLLLSSIHEETKLVILDEPTWGIDFRGEAVLLEILFMLTKEIKDISFLIISHDLCFISRLNARILWIQDGSLFLSKDIYSITQAMM